MPLTNATEVVDSPAGRIRVSGVDDPYIGRHRTEHISRAAGEVAAIGLMHAPDVVSNYALHGFDLVLGGHTHAGQVRLPWLGALVTNCSLPAALAGGLHGVGAAWLHVSPGLGSSRYFPFRFLARPEATLLRLVPEP
jgi:predicted MPP superfamily phosphohydrolase